MRTINAILTGCCLSLAIIAATGCSPTGWATKTIHDGSSLQPGDQISLLCDGGNIIRGEFTGTGMIPSADYNRLYTLSTQKPFDGKYLPAIGQTVQVTTAVSDTRDWIGQFLGFDGVNLLMKPAGESETEKIYFSSLTSLSGYDGSPIRRMKLRSMFQDGMIPLMKALIVRENDKTVMVPISSIREVRIGSGGGEITASGNSTILDDRTLRTMFLR